MSDAIYTCSRTAGVAVADGATAAISSTISLSGASISALALSPDEAYLYAADTVLAKIETATNTVLLSTTLNVGSGLGSAVVSADGTKLFVTAVSHSAISVYNTSTLARTGFFNGFGTVQGPGLNSGITLSPDGSQLAVALSDGIEFFDASTFSRLGAYKGNYTTVYGAIYSPDGTEVFVLGTQPSPNQTHVDIVSTSTFAKTGAVNLGASNPTQPNDGCFSPDGSTLWLNDNANLQIYEIQSGVVASTTPVSPTTEAMTCLQVSPDGSNLYFSDTVKLYRFNTGALAVQASGTNGADYNLKVIGGSAPPPPTAPTLNVADASCPPEITNSWSTVDGATYNLYRGTASGMETLYQSGLTETSYADDAVVNGATYFYYVTAVVDGVESVASNEIMAAANCPEGCQFNLNPYCAGNSYTQASGPKNVWTKN
ncbi:MAG TPA: hypothetical protein VJQ82_17180 [Terriglobales bacterium]|nr:hypothetical protein [Terriglobales bacterium]